MKLTLAIPGLTWLDAHDGAEVTRELDTPALSRLLGRAQLESRASALSQLIGLPFGLGELNLARLCARNDGLDADHGHWLIAEPVHLRIERDQALLADVGVMRLSRADADQLIAGLNQHFASDGLRFHAPTPGRWYLELPHGADARFAALADVVGENVDHHLPQGAAGLNWSRMINEMQMLLHDHPVNEAREARNETSVNSLWLWGAGDETAPSAPLSELSSGDDIMKMLARACHIACPDTPASLPALLEAHRDASALWVHLDHLQAAAQYRDAWGWREGLSALDAAWFAPLLHAMKRGQIDSLTLLTHGPAGFSARLNRGSLWKIWRAPRALASLY